MLCLILFKKLCNCVLVYGTWGLKIITTRWCCPAKESFLYKASKSMYKFCVYHCRGCSIRSLLVTELFILKKIQ